uniref:Nudix hydrolase domain-containing protein n=1 Tax=Rhabditophanes sp. KR3021 TaxID=114890 RepID=A0AC35UB74_9BILA
MALSKVIKSASTILWNSEVKHVLMLQRGNTAKFMPGAYVFPGGVSEQQHDFSFPVDSTNFGAVMSQPILCEEMKTDFGMRITSLRELFEETGLLMVADKANSEKEVLSTLDDPALAKARVKVKEDPSSFKDIFKDFIADVQCLTPWSNWLTPNIYPKRFNTVFFGIDVKENHKIDLCSKEMSDHIWKKPSHIIDSVHQGRSLPPPQFYELCRIRLLGKMKMHQLTDPTLLYPQVAKCPDDPDIIITLLPGDFLYQLEDQQNIRMLRFTKQQLDLESTTKPIHRMTYHLNPIYTSQQLHIKNINPKSKDKIHLFYLQQNKPWLH